MHIDASGSEVVDTGEPRSYFSTQFTKDLVFFAVAIVVGLLVIAFSFDEPIDLILERWPVFFTAIVAAAVANATAVGGGFIFMPLFTFGYGFTSLESLKLALATQAFGMSSGALAWSVKRIVMSVLGFSLVFALENGKTIRPKAQQSVYGLIPGVFTKKIQETRNSIF